MSLYLAEYIGTGTEEDPYRPDGSDGVEAWHSIDLSPSKGSAKGLCLLSVPGDLSGKVSRDKIAERASEKVSLAMTKKAGLRLGVNLEEQANFGALVASLLLEHASPDRWEKLRPVGGRYEINLGGQIWSMPLISGGATLVEDDFNYADGAIKRDWMGFFGDGINGIDVKNQQGRYRAAATTSGSFGIFYGVVLDSADHWAEITFTQFPVTSGTSGNSSNTGPITRKPTGSTHDLFVGRIYPKNNQLAITKYIGGAATDLSGITYTAPAVPFTLRMHSQGSSHYLNVDGVEKIRVTDTALPSNVYVGLRDNFSPAASTDSGKTFVDNFRGRIIEPVIGPPVGVQII